MENQITLELVYNEIISLKSHFYTKNLKNSREEYLTPMEVCAILKISRNKYESMKINGFIKVYKLTPDDPKCRKYYCKRSEIQEMFPKDFT